ncbi:XtrA/YqaO family protein [Pseudobacillus sp. 179-B 2D1 NHS]|uniref:XtrA/YqaO family protein n=1 Tax=Pseudobacillus sp. 179-B 2D1 NHS TaxID=3374292 RepID=UPI0038797C18
MKEVEININDLSVTQKIKQGKVLVLILDGNQGKAKYVEAVHHGNTIVETVKGEAKRIKFEESVLF